jgi:hypothetical protein
MQEADAERLKEPGRLDDRLEVDEGKIREPNVNLSDFGKKFRRMCSVYQLYPKRKGLKESHYREKYDTDYLKTPVLAALCFYAFWRGAHRLFAIQS